MKRQIGSGRCISNEAKKVRMLKSLSLNNLLLKTKQDRNWLLAPKNPDRWCSIRDCNYEWDEWIFGVSSASQILRHNWWLWRSFRGSHSVWKSHKMSHLNFSILATNFYMYQNLVTLFDRIFQVFQWTSLAMLNETFSVTFRHRENAATFWLPLAVIHYLNDKCNLTQLCFSGKLFRKRPKIIRLLKWEKFLIFAYLKWSK